MSEVADQPDGGCSARDQQLRVRASIYLETSASIQLTRTAVRDLNSKFAIPLSEDDIEEAIIAAIRQRDKPKVL